MKDITVIMAGGLGKRMNSTLPKVLHVINNKPMICHVISLALKVSDHILIVVGKYKEIIQKTIDEYFPDNNFEYILQDEPLGTGHCIQCCMQYLNANFEDNDNVFILSGDVPLLSLETLNALRNHCNSVLITNRSNPYGYGRVLLENNKIVGIVEEKDCTVEQKQITLVNCGIYYIRLDILSSTISKISNDNANREYYLPDIIKFYDNFVPCITNKEYEIFNINTQQELEIAKQFISEI